MSASDGRAVRMRGSRYTCIESALTMAPPIASASSSARRDLPLAVGPAIRMASTAKAETSMSDASEIARFTMLAEEAMSALYDARGVNVRAALEDAAYNI